MNPDLIIHDVQVGSTGETSGSIAERWLDGGVDAIFEEKIEPFLGLCKGVLLWCVGGWEPVPSGKIPFSVLPSKLTGFRPELDPRQRDLIDDLPALTRSLVTIHERTVYNYVGAVKYDANLMNAALYGSAELDEELRWQLSPYKGSKVIVDAWADAGLNDIRFFRMCRYVTGQVPGVEGTPRAEGAIQAYNVPSLWLKTKYLSGPAMIPISEVHKRLLGQKIEMFRGWIATREEKVARIEENEARGIFSCLNIRDIF